MKNKMYSIFFHISGIALLEVCFFFYYIGPMETKHFQDVVKKLVDEPFFTIEDTISTEIISRSRQLAETNFNLQLNNTTVSIAQYIQSYVNETIGKNQNDLEKMRNNAIKRRTEKNEQLFIQTIEYWVAFTFMTLLLYLLYSKYQEIVRLNEVRDSIVNVRSHDYDIEMSEYTRYRKNSEHQETLEEPARHKYYETCQKMGHYLLFAICIISFQYFFFETIVLSYDPLTIDEVKYIIYSKILSNA